MCVTVAKPQDVPDTVDTPIRPLFFVYLINETILLSDNTGYQLQTAANRVDTTWLTQSFGALTTLVETRYGYEFD
ncbi:hypothetical protein J6590_077464 [Homalodisca vitripennis]|nr:hypothetical protein J6590_077464 [Homalodisca vitripennis]